MFTNKVPKPKVSETFILVPLETAPASNLSDIAEADYAIVEDNNSLPNKSE